MQHVMQFEKRHYHIQFTLDTYDEEDKTDDTKSEGYEEATKVQACASHFRLHEAHTVGSQRSDISEKVEPQIEPLEIKQSLNRNRWG